MTEEPKSVTDMLYSAGPTAEEETSLKSEWTDCLDSLKSLSAAWIDTYGNPNDEEVAKQIAADIEKLKNLEKSDG